MSYRSAVREIFGELGWSEVVAALPTEARRELVERPVSPISWIPERHMLALSEAIFEGPAARSERAYVELLREMVNQGFGRLRRFLVRFAPPGIVLARAPEFWRHDHSDGELVVHPGERTTRVEIRGHVYATTELARMTAAETFRIILTLTRAEDVTCAQRLLHDRTFEVSLSWT